VHLLVTVVCVRMTMHGMNSIKCIMIFLVEKSEDLR
jgi:hypothetical protein